MINPLLHSNELQSEAQVLLDKTNLIEKLESFGSIELGGSFVYGTMVIEDIDINVIVDKSDLNYKLRMDVMTMLLGIDNLGGIAMTDKMHFPANTAPKGIWFGPIIWHNNKRWNIDIWFVTKDEPYSHHNQELHRKMKNINDSQRNIILDIKTKLLKNNLYQKGKTSSDVYRAVLYKGATNYQDFVNLN